MRQCLFKGFELALIKFTTKICLHSFILRIKHEKQSLKSFLFQLTLFWMKIFYSYYCFSPVKKVFLDPKASICREPACLMKIYKHKQRYHFQEAFTLGMGKGNSSKQMNCVLTMRVGTATGTSWDLVDSACCFTLLLFSHTLKKSIKNLLQSFDNLFTQCTMAVYPMCQVPFNSSHFIALELDRISVLNKMVNNSSGVFEIFKSIFSIQFNLCLIY